jgi:hypothetical protein
MLQETRSLNSTGSTPISIYKTKRCHKQEATNVTMALKKPQTSTSSKAKSTAVFLLPTWKVSTPKIPLKKKSKVHGENSQALLSELSNNKWLLTLLYSWLLNNGYRWWFLQSKVAEAWSWPVTSIYCRGQEWWSYTSVAPHVFMAWCLIN